MQTKRAMRVIQLALDMFVCIRSSIIQQQQVIINKNQNKSHHLGSEDEN